MTAAIEKARTGLRAAARNRPHGVLTAAPHPDTDDDWHVGSKVPRRESSRR